MKIFFKNKHMNKPRNITQVWENINLKGYQQSYIHKSIIYGRYNRINLNFC